MGQSITVDRTGFRFVVCQKWKHKEKRIGTLTISVGGLRWLPPKGKAHRHHSWSEVAEWLAAHG